VWLLVQVGTSGDSLAANAHISTGPAHAVYFATYEAVKHLMGGNQAGVHHPLAAGMFCWISRFSRLFTNTWPATSGACATIASDALMNPFDGMSLAMKG
jgi:solute carrier family 25 (mitochondrial iron transporter), member 28/37